MFSRMRPWSAAIWSDSRLRSAIWLEICSTFNFCFSMLSKACCRAGVTRFCWARIATSSSSRLVSSTRLSSGWMASTVSSAVFPASVAAAAAQPPQAGPAFEVASVKVAAPSPDLRSGDSKNGTLLFKFRNEGGPGTASPGRWTCTNISLYQLLFIAWTLDAHQLSGPPSMLDARYDVLAKLPPRASRADFNLLIQRLLIERTGLVAPHARNDLDVRGLVIAKGGPKMKPAEAALADAPAVAPRISLDKDGNPWLPQ